jgi:hypothetical protein
MAQMMLTSCRFRIAAISTTTTTAAAAADNNNNNKPDIIYDN